MNSSAAATVSMVNLENGESESRAREVQWMRLQSLESSIAPIANSLIGFKYCEILAATCNFLNRRVLGRGALSCVFRGTIGLLRTAVAIKRLDKADKETFKAFCRELMIASSLHNPNVILLLGFCIDAEVGLFLVYKYASLGSLECHSHGRKKNSSLPWSVRYKVAIGIAEAVAYLHNGTEGCVVHRDIKPFNILLSSNKTPKLCDFGLATWTSAPSVPFLCKTVKGTFGYLAPEYFQHGEVSDKTDVYSFGVVLLELITGRKPIEAKRLQERRTWSYGLAIALFFRNFAQNFMTFAKPFLQTGEGALHQLLDPRLKGSILRYSSQMIHMIEAAAVCVTNEELQMPGIHQIIAILEGQKELALCGNKKSRFLGNECVIECCPQLQQTHSERKNHMALAMLGVSEFEGNDYLYCR